MNKDMTKGNIIKLIISFSIPLLIGNIFQQFYSMVDTIIVGRFIGVHAIAAVGSTGSIFFLITGFIIGLTSGFSVLISQRFGAQDEEGMKKAVANAIILAAISTVIITLVSSLGVGPLLEMMNTPSDIIGDAKSYITIISLGVFATILYNLMASMLRAIGDSKTPLYFLILATFINIILDVVFIVNFNMGVAGVAFATLLSQFISGLLSYFYARRKYNILQLEKHHFKPDYEFINKHLKIAIPMALQFPIIAFGGMIVQVALNSMGSTIIASFTAALKVEQLVMQPAISIGITLATFTAQNLGAKQLVRIKNGVKKGIIISISLSIMAMFIANVFGKPIVSLFITEGNDEVIRYAKQYLSTASMFYIPLGLIFVYRNTLQGLGQSFIPMFAGALELIARVIVVFILAPMFGYVGVILAGPFAWLSAFLLVIITYYRKINKIDINKV